MKKRASPKATKRYPLETVVCLDEIDVEKGFNTAEPGPVGELVASFKELGMQNPLHVRRLPDRKSLSLIDGHRRYQAAQLAGFEKVKVVDHGYINDVDAKTVAYSQNVLRRKISKREVMGTCKFMAAAGLNGSDIARRLGLGKSTVSEYLTLSRASPKLRKAAEKATSEGGIPTKTALRAAKLTKRKQDQATPKLVGKTNKEAETVLGPKPSAHNIGVPMPEGASSGSYRLVSDYKERCRKLELEVQKRLRQTPSNQRLQGMELVIGVLKGKLTVEQAFVDWQKA